MSKGLGWLVTLIRCNLPKNKKMQELHTILFQCYSKHITPEQLPSFEQWCRAVTWWKRAMRIIHVVHLMTLYSRQ